MHSSNAEQANLQIVIPAKHENFLHNFKGDNFIIKRDRRQKNVDFAHTRINYFPFIFKKNWFSWFKNRRKAII